MDKAEEKTIQRKTERERKERTTSSDSLRTPKSAFRTAGRAALPWARGDETFEMSSFCPTMDFPALKKNRGRLGFFRQKTLLRTVQSFLPFPSAFPASPEGSKDHDKQHRLRKVRREATADVWLFYLGQVKNPRAALSRSNVSAALCDTPERSNNRAG